LLNVAALPSYPVSAPRAFARLTGQARFLIVDPMAMITLDLIGLHCPLPALKTRKALARLMPGDRLQVHCTDPLAAIDIPNLVRETGDRLECARPAQHGVVFLIEKTGGAGRGEAGD
jgi:tRNA 2-thiouridine synthesizing protein A